MFNNTWCLSSQLKALNKAGQHTISFIKDKKKEDFILNTFYFELSLKKELLHYCDKDFLFTDF